jgi:hypothetical protein
VVPSPAQVNTGMTTTLLSSAPATSPRRWAWLPDDTRATVRRFVVAGAGWAVVAALLALAALLPLALGRGAPIAPLGPGRLDAAYRWVGLWGMVSLPLAGALLWVAGGAGPGRAGARAAGLAFWVWHAGLLLGLGLVIMGQVAPDAWTAAPAAAQALLGVGLAAWAVAVWQVALAAPGRMTFARMAALTAVVALASFTLVRLMGTGIGGAGQAVALAIGTRGLLDGWVAVAGVAVAATALAEALQQPLFGRWPALVGLALWLPLAVVAAGRDAAPDLLPGLLTRLVLAAAALLMVPGTLLAVALLGTWIGAERRAPAPAALFGSAAMVALWAAVLAGAAGTVSVAGDLAFTAWVPTHALVPPMAVGMLFAGSATYLVLRPGPGGPWPRRHLALAAGAALLTVAALCVVGLAEAASGPSAALLTAEARLRLPGALLGLLAAVAWVFAAVRPGVAASFPVVAGDLSARPGTVVGAAVIGVVGALFVVLFMPLADPSAVSRTARTDARLLSDAPLRAEGRARYVAEGCVACHTQRVRALTADGLYGSPSLRGDYGDGPALAGARRAGPDLMWVGDRYGTREAMGVALAAHTAGGPVAMPWLWGASGPTDAGLALLDYLVGLRSRGERTP